MVLAQDTETRARAGRLVTPHGVITTPAFMPVGTLATVKGVTPEELQGLGAEAVLCNTYHLMLRPGHRLIHRLGGLHRFMHWEGPILTDSGGYQVFSLGTLRKVSEEGVLFQSPLDGGARHTLTPELAVEVQEALGADMVTCLDECSPYPASREQVQEAMERTTRWAERCRRARSRSDQFLFGIVQGGTHPDLRQAHARELVRMGFDGYAIGGLSVGEGQGLMLDMVEATVEVLPEDRPRYLMGVGRPEDLVEAMARGVDLFDCVMPTRHGRNGQLFTGTGILNIRHARYAEDPAPVDPGCTCMTCTHYSRAYLRHLVLAREILAARLGTLHNLHYYLDLVRRAREAIVAGTYAAFRQHFYAMRGVEP